MKHQQAPKWLLTTALLAVLGANYSFQTNSLVVADLENSGVFEMSLTAAETSGGARGTRGTSTVTTTSASPTVTTKSVSPTATVSPTAVVSPTALPKTAEKPAVDNTGKEVNFMREGKVLATGTCADGSCKSVVLDMATLEKFAANLVSATSRVAPTSQVAAAVTASATVVAAAEADYDCDFTEDGKPETRTQKRDRLKCVKNEKERVKKEDRIAKFEDKMDDIKDRCEVTTSETKLECLTREFNNAASRYSGRNAIPASVAQRYFKNVVGAELSKMLFNNEITPQQAMSTLQDVFDGLPSEYGVIRQNILTAIQNETKTRAQAINQQYKLADTLKNKPQQAGEYLQLMGEAQQAQTELGQMVDVYSAAARTSDAFSEDTSFSRYYQTNYMPQMKSLFASMGVQGSTGTTTTPEKVENPTRGNTRGGATTGTPTSIPNAGTRGQATTTTKVGASNPPQWSFLDNSSSGVRVGAPSNTSNGGTRGARTMGNN